MVQMFSQTAVSGSAVLVSHSSPASRSQTLNCRLKQRSLVLNMNLKRTSSPQSDLLSPCLYAGSVVGLYRAVFWIGWLTVCADEALRVWSDLHVTQRRVAVCMCAGSAAGVAAAAAAGRGTDGSLCCSLRGLVTLWGHNCPLTHVLCQVNRRSHFKNNFVQHMSSNLRRFNPLTWVQLQNESTKIEEDNMEARCCQEEKHEDRV